MGVAPQELEQIKLNLDFAELVAGVRRSAVRGAAGPRCPGGSPRPHPLKELAYRARFLLARALEAQGLVDDAVIELETLLTPRVGQRAPDQGRHRAGPVLQDPGDFTKAVEVGEMLLEHLTGHPARHHRRGRAAGRQHGRCVLLPRRHRARPSGSAARRWPRRRRSTRPWRGPRPTGMPASSRRAGARSATQCPWHSVLSRCSPRVRTAGTWPCFAPTWGSCNSSWTRRSSMRPSTTWRTAAEEMQNCSAGPVDIGRNELAQARAHYLSGDLDLAEAMTTRVQEKSADSLSTDRGRRKVTRRSGSRSSRRRAVGRGSLPPGRAHPDRGWLGPRGRGNVVRARWTARRRRGVRRCPRRIPQCRGSKWHPVAAAHQGNQQAGCKIN